MKFTIDEYRMMLQAVVHDADEIYRRVEVCRNEGRELAGRYYGDCYQDYKKLFDKMCEMMDDITE